MNSKRVLAQLTDQTPDTSREKSTSATYVTRVLDMIIIFGKEAFLLACKVTRVVNVRYSQMIHMTGT